MEMQTPAAEGLVAPAWFDSALHWIALWFEAAGVAAIALGAVFAVALVGRRAVRGDDWGQAYHLFRTPRRDAPARRRGSARGSPSCRSSSSAHRTTHRGRTSRRCSTSPTSISPTTAPRPTRSTGATSPRCRPRTSSGLTPMRTASTIP
jgi:hypothetical protein